MQFKKKVLFPLIVRAPKLIICSFRLILIILFIVNVMIFYITLFLYIILQNIFIYNSIINNNLQWYIIILSFKNYKLICSVENSSLVFTQSQWPIQRHLIQKHFSFLQNAIRLSLFFFDTNKNQFHCKVKNGTNTQLFVA